MGKGTEKRFKQWCSAAILLAMLLMPILTLGEESAEADFIWGAYRGLRRFEKDGKIGLMDEENNVRVPALYDDIWSRMDGYLGEHPVFSAIEGDYDTCYLWDTCEPLFTAYRKGTLSWGITNIDNSGIYLFFRHDEGRIYFSTEEGEVLGVRDWQGVMDFFEGFCAVEREGKWGYIDTTGEVVVPIIWDKACLFENGYAKVRQGEKWGLVDTTGSTVVAPVWDNIFPFTAGWALVVKDDQYGYINQQGEMLTENMMNDAWRFSNGMAKVRGQDSENGHLYGYINTEGEMIIPAKYKSFYSFEENGTVRVSYGAGENGIIDKQGNEILEPVWEKAYTISCFDLYPDNKNVIPAKDDMIMAINNKNIENDGKITHFFDIQGNLLFTVEGTIRVFSEGLAIVYGEEDYYVLHSNGDMYPFPEGTMPEKSPRDEAGSPDPSRFAEGVLVVKTEEGLLGAIDPKGNCAIEPVYNDMSLFCEDGLFGVEKEGKWCFINKKGEPLTPNGI